MERARALAGTGARDPPAALVSGDHLCRMPGPDPFLQLPLTRDTQDLYWIRNSILHALKSALPLCHGEFLDIGCGVQPYRQLITNAPSRVTRYIGMDLGGQKVKTYAGVPPDIEWDGRTIP